MATMITDECINCGACEPECPNTAIYQGGVEFDALDGSKQGAISNEFFYIVPEKCTECVGFFDHEACAAVCPVDCCVPDPDIPETEDVLFARAKEIHPSEEFAEDFPSRFKVKDEPEEEAAEAGAAPAAGGAVAAAGGAVVAAPAAVVHFGKVERKGAEPLRQPELRETLYTGELDNKFDDVKDLVEAGAPGGGVSGPLRIALAAAQPLLGAMPASTKVRLEQAVGDPMVFSASGSTGLNILAHVIILPAIAVALAVIVGGENLYSLSMSKWFLLGGTIAVLEAIIRLRETVIFAKPPSEIVWRGSFYGLPFVPLVLPIIARAEKAHGEGEMAHEGFYETGGAYDEKRERERRYGEIYTLSERPAGWLFRLELPRTIPPSGVKDELGLGDEMPDYDLDISLVGGWLQVKGAVVDERLRTVAATAPAFPPNFVTRVPLGAPCAGFVQWYEDKVLEVVVLKAEAIRQLPREADAA